MAAPRSTRPSIRPPDAPGDRGEDAPNAPPRSKSVNLESELGEATPYTSGKFQRVTEELLNPSGESIEQTEEAGATGGFVPLPRHADGVDYDEELDFLIRVAAQAGLPRGVPNAINYTTLLIGFALCSDRASRWLQRLRPDKFRRDELLASRKLTREGARIVSRARQLLLPADRSPYSPSATLVLQRAGEVAALVASRSDGASADRRIGTRHLLAAFLFRNPGEHEADLLQWLNSTDVRLAFSSLIEANWPAEAAGWGTLFLEAELPGGREHAGDVAQTRGDMLDARGQVADAEATVMAGAERYVASFGADDPSIQRRDLLDVKDEARAFARIAASGKTRLPLSIGVFGEWGSGKTFFMELMSEHVKRLSSRAKDGKKSLFLPDIVQIRFNAWHYIESNLWASLVEYIFSELDRSLQGNQKPREQVERMFEQLSTSRLLKLEAIENLIVKRHERKAAEERLDGARRDYEGALLRQSAATSTDFWQAVLRTFKEKLKKDGPRVEKLARELGLKDLSKSASSLNEVLKEAETEAGRARVLNRAMVAKLGQGWWIAAIVLTLIVLPVGLVLLKDALIPGADWIAKVNSAVLAFSGMLAAASGLVGKAVGSTRKALTELEGFRNKLDAAVKERTEKFKKESGEAATFAGAEREIARLKNELEQAERKFAEADKRSDEVLRDYQSATARGRLNAFIRDKLASGDYAKHLGLIATIRKDFEQLAQLMADAENDGKSRADYMRAHEEYRKRLADLLQRAKDKGALSEDELVELGKDTTPPEPGLFTRIILYIDDLDRCPPDKVVDVLQAIHLLLYFPLFVVVVAVDARWVSRSLREQFPQLLAENIIAPRRKRASGARTAERGGTQERSDEESESANDAPASSRRRDAELPTAATSHDYLEKIFQIPYWVRPMDRDASMRYVKGIADVDVKKSADTDTSPGAERPTPTRLAGSGVASPAPAPPSGSAQDTTPEVPGAVPMGAPSSAPVQQVPELAQGADPQTDEETEQQAEYVARSMTLTKQECDFLEALAPFVGSTPRRGLRFVNIYRLVKTSLPEPLQKELVSESGDRLAYRALITQLAIVTGAPHISWGYFQLLRNSAAGIERRAAEPSAPTPEGEETIEMLLALCKRLKDELAAADGRQKTALLGALEQLYLLNEKHGVDTGRQLLLALDRFAPIARRYSFTARPH